jgi:hypothetical protein
VGTGKQEKKLCRVSGCGRPAYAHRYCATHRRQILKKGRTRPIRPYRRRVPGTVKVAGLRLSREAAQGILREAAQRQVSLGAAIASAVESWWMTQRRRRQPIGETGGTPDE